IDGRWDRLKAVREAGYKPPTSHPDIDPPHEALQLVEQFKEMARDAGARGKAADFVSRAEAAARGASDFEGGLGQYGTAAAEATRKKVEDAFVAVGKNCTACHVRHRDNRK